MSFFAARRDRVLLGVGALKRLDADHAEIKSMHTAAEAAGRVSEAAMSADHLVAVAAARGHRRVSLETGATEAFVPARALRGGRLRALRPVRRVRPTRTAPA